MPEIQLKSNRVPPPCSSQHAHPTPDSLPVVPIQPACSSTRNEWTWGCGAARRGKLQRGFVICTLPLIDVTGVRTNRVPWRTCPEEFNSSVAWPRNPYTMIHLLLRPDSHRYSTGRARTLAAGDVVRTGHPRFPGSLLRTPHGPSHRAIVMKSIRERFIFCN